MQRDDPLDNPPDMDEKPSTYHIENIERLASRRRYLESASDAELMAEQKETFERERAFHIAEIAKDAALATTYRRMIAEVEKWTPPTDDHKEFKSFMLEQLRDSIKWDCDSTYHKDHLKQLAAPLVSVADYRRQQIAATDKDIAYHDQRMAEEIERVNGRNEWKRQLLESLKGGQP